MSESGCRGWLATRIAEAMKIFVHLPQNQTGVSNDRVPDVVEHKDNVRNVLLDPGQ